MKLRNLKMNESISKQYEHALEDEHTILEPTEANALKVEEERKEVMEDDFKEQNKIADEIAKDTNATEVNEPKKVKDRKELSRLLAEAKEAGKQYKISRCGEEGYRYLFETIEVEETTNEVLTEEVSARPNHDKVLDMLSQGVLEYKTVAEECLSAMSDDLIGEVLKDFDLEECKKSLKEENGDPSLDEKLPETFEGKMDFLAADEEEAIEGYDKVLLALEEGDPAREQLEKIRDEEVAHKEFLEKVKSDKNAVYKAPSEVEEVKDAVDLDEKCKENLEESKLEESDEPAAESIENCQKWVDYDMEHYGDVSKNTQEIIEKAGFQLIKDDHGDYEVAARDYEESLNEETNMEKINRALDSLDMKEDLGEEDHFDFTSELYDSIRAVLKEYASKGVTKDDLSAALSFIDVHMDDDEELEFLDKNEIEAKAKSAEIVEEVESEDEVVEEKLEEASGKKSAGTVLNDCQDVWGVATSPDQMRSLIIKCLDDHKDEMEESNYKYAKTTFERASRNAIYGLVAAFTTGVAMTPNKEHKQNVKDLTDSLEEVTSETKETLIEECEGCKEEEIEEVEDDEKPFEEEKVEYEIDDDFDWKY